MSTKVNVDNFVIGPKWRTFKWSFIRRHPLSYMHNRLQWYYYPKSHKTNGFPLHVDFETSAVCNMSCPMCFRSRKEYDPSKFGIMDYDLFKKGIDECSSHKLYSIRLSWRGECTANPHLVDMVHYAKQKGIKEISFITNGWKLEGKLAEELVKSGVDYITISVDGLYEEYNKVRHPATFEGTVERIRNLRMLRETLGKGYPRIRINSVWNEEKGMDWFQKMYDYFQSIADYMTFTPEYPHDGRKKELKPDFTCQYPFQRISIMWNGVIPLCIADKHADYTLGSLDKDSIYDVWHGKKFEAVREQHLSNSAKEITPCSVCDRATTRQIGNIAIR